MHAIAETLIPHGWIWSTIQTLVEDLETTIKSIAIKISQRSVNGAYTKIVLVTLYRLDKLILVGVL